jgi:hypothetical protein
MKRLILGLLCVNFFVWAGEIEYRRAQSSDVDAVVDLMGEAASYTDRVSIVPKFCRKSFVEDMIKRNVLFIAVSDDKVVGIKKFFIAEGAEKKNVLENLIRSEGEKADKAPLRNKLGNEGKIVSSLSSPAPKDLGVCLYSGFGYTEASFRKQKVYKNLAEYAYAETVEQVRAALRTSGGRKITFMFVLAEPNVGLSREDDLHPNVGYDRTSSMARGFQAFIKKYFAKPADVIELESSRYKSFLPTFDQESQECKPLPDDDARAVPDFGYVLTYELKNDFV